MNEWAELIGIYHSEFTSAISIEHVCNYYVKLLMMRINHRLKNYVLIVLRCLVSGQTREG